MQLGDEVLLNDCSLQRDGEDGIIGGGAIGGRMERDGGRSSGGDPNRFEQTSLEWRKIRRRRNGGVGDMRRRIGEASSIFDLPLPLLSNADHRLLPFALHHSHCLMSRQLSSSLCPRSEFSFDDSTMHLKEGSGLSYIFIYLFIYFQRWEL